MTMPDSTDFWPSRTDILQKKLSLLCAFTSCRGVSPLHVCAEFNSRRCARVLLDNGADVNARAGHDREGIGGTRPFSRSE